MRYSHRVRLDVALTKMDLAESRERAKRLIKSGYVRVDGRIIKKPSFLIDSDVQVSVSGSLQYVSRGGVKIEAALNLFDVDVSGFICMDVGTSTGGFTDCLLQHGATRVYAIDVGRGQIAATLKNDTRVIVLENMDIRDIEYIPDPIDLITVDVSFISLRLVLPSVYRYLKPTGSVIALIKPQFEGGPKVVNKRGIIKNKRIREKIVMDLTAWMKKQGWYILGLIQSPIKGKHGNQEYLIHLRR